VASALEALAHVELAVCTILRPIPDINEPAQKLSSSYKQLIIGGVLVAASSCTQAYPSRLGILRVR